MSRWLFFPSPAVSTLEVATVPQWLFNSTTIPVESKNLVAGPYGAGALNIQLRTDANGAFFQFTSSTTANAWLTNYSTYGLRITDSNANVYEWSGGTMSIFAGSYIKLPLANWSGTIPTVGFNSTTMELF